MGLHMCGAGDKRHLHFCLFCKKFFTAAASHIARRHSREPEVAKLLPLKKSKSGHKDYVFGMVKLRNLGNFLHNVKVLRGEESSFLVAKRTTVLREPSDYLPCLYCFGFYEGNVMSRHAKRCASRCGGAPCKSTKSMNRAFIEAACMFGRVEELLRNARVFVHEHFADSEICTLLEEDDLVLCYGHLCVRTLGKARVVLKLTLLGKLLLTLKERQPTKTSLGSFISDACFYDVLEAAETLCGMSIIGEGQKAYKARMSFHTLRSVLVYVGIVKRAWALVARDKQSQLDSEGFLSRLHCEWPEAHPSHPEKSVPSLEQRDKTVQPSQSEKSVPSLEQRDKTVQPSQSEKSVPSLEQRDKTVQPSHPEKSVPSLEQRDKTVQPSQSETALSVSSGNLTSPLVNVDALCSAAASNFIPPTASTNSDFVIESTGISSVTSTTATTNFLPTSSTNTDPLIGSTGVSSVAGTDTNTGSHHEAKTKANKALDIHLKRDASSVSEIDRKCVSYVVY